MGSLNIAGAVRIDDMDTVLLVEISTGYVLSGIFLFPALLSIFRKKMHFQNLLFARAESLLKGDIPCSLQTT